MVQKKKKVTIRDVARKAGVSYQTVSRVMNEHESVAEETRKRVLGAMKELDFVPNKIAQMLTTNQSHTLELIIVGVKQGGLLANSIRNMAQAAKDAGYDLLVTLADIDELGMAFGNAEARQVDGVIMYAPSLRISDEKLLALCSGMPLVRRDYVPDSRLAWVGFDQVYAARMATEYLIGLGHRQIAAIPPALELINGQWRLQAFKETLHKHGLEPGPVCDSRYSASNGYEAIYQILAANMPFSAVFIGSDAIAFGALRGLHEHGLRIPEDVSVISFDNSEFASFTEPPLTTIDFAFSQQDAMAVKYLIEILNNPEMKLHQRILLPELVVRNSVQKHPGMPGEQTFVIPDMHHN